MREESVKFLKPVVQIEDFEAKKRPNENLKDKETQNANDFKLFEKFLKKGLVSAKNVIMKSPGNRTDKEIEFMVFYLKFKHA